IRAMPPSTGISRSSAKYSFMPLGRLAVTTFGVCTVCGGGYLRSRGDQDGALLAGTAALRPPRPGIGAGETGTVAPRPPLATGSSPGIGLAACANAAPAVRMHKAAMPRGAVAP